MRVWQWVMALMGKGWGRVRIASVGLGLWHSTTAIATVCGVLRFSIQSIKTLTFDLHKLLRGARCTLKGPYFKASLKLYPTEY